MKTPYALLLAALLVPAVPALAQFESARLAPDNAMPPFPAALQMAGITRGYAVVAVSIDAEGKVQESLVLAETHPHIARTALAALRDWQFRPARLDGLPVPVQTEVRIDFTLEGAVITSNAVNHFFFDGFENAGDLSASRQLCPANQLDRAPQRLAGDAPQYALDAGKAGIAGHVQVHFYIDENGNVRMAGAQPVAGTHPYLMEQAVRAVRAWKFEPPTSRGRPVVVAAVQEFDFGGGR
jgi:TonB family protein